MTDGISAAAAPDSTIQMASTEARGLVENVIAKLDDALTEDQPQPRPFFPNGIELIFVKVEAGLTEKTKVSVELKIAGAKGLGEKGVVAVTEDAAQPPQEPAAAL